MKTYHFVASVLFPHPFLWSSLLHGSQMLTATQSMNEIHTVDGVKKNIAPLTTAHLPSFKTFIKLHLDATCVVQNDNRRL